MITLDPHDAQIAPVGDVNVLEYLLDLGVDQDAAVRVTLRALLNHAWLTPRQIEEAAADAGVSLPVRLDQLPSSVTH